MNDMQPITKPIDETIKKAMNKIEFKLNSLRGLLLTYRHREANVRSLELVDAANTLQIEIDKLFHTIK